MEKITSQRKKELWLKDGYCYRLARKNVDNSESWRCLQKNCRGRLRVVNNCEVIIVNEHSHAPNPTKNEAKQCVHKIRELASNTVERPRQIFQRATHSVSLEAAIFLPEYCTAQRNIERIRRSAEHPYASPRTVADIVIPDTLKITTRNQNFLLWDSGNNDPNRMFMFGTEENLNILQQHGHWFVDGTFKVSPEIFYQVFTVHGLVDNRACPLIYVLMQDKREESYVRVFQKLADLKENLHPESVLCDFEKAVQNAVSRTFPDLQAIGCLFHLGQNLWRKVQEFNLTELYRHDDNLRQCTKMLLALSFVPTDDVVAAFETLTEICPDDMDNLINYWEDTYIGRMRRNRRSVPLFPISVWNMFNRVTSDLPRTNNSVEGWHRAFQQTVDCHNPSIFKIIEHFRKEQNQMEIQLHRYEAGFRRPEASKNKYVQINNRIRILTQNYNRNEIINYLRGVSYNLEI